MMGEKRSEWKCQRTGNVRFSCEGESATLWERERQRDTDWSRTGGPVRWKRVLELRLAIQTGTYKVSVDQVADSLIRFVGRQDRQQGELHSA